MLIELVRRVPLCPQLAENVPEKNLQLSIHVSYRSPQISFYSTFRLFSTTGEVQEYLLSKGEIVHSHVYNAFWTMLSIKFSEKWSES